MRERYFARLLIKEFISNNNEKDEQWTTFYKVADIWFNRIQEVVSHGHFKLQVTMPQS